jgi:23S rRNA (cytosine1962-C5)-methyltransferase
MAAIILKPGREKSVLYRHPWIFSGAIREINGTPRVGETVDVHAASGDMLGRAAFSPSSKIQARMWSWNPDEQIDEDFFRRRLQAALELRRSVIPAGESDALRLVHAESDGLPGLVVDRYAGLLVMQCLSAGTERWRETFANLLSELTGITQIYERSDVEVRRLEGLLERDGALRGEPPAGPIEINEHGLRFLVDPVHGQKTGFYIDQRRNRHKLMAVSSGRDVLNCFCYTGAFSVYALAGGARSVLSIDTSAEALAAAQNHVALNGLERAGVDWLEADVFHALRTFRDQGRSFDVIVLDPPKFAPTAAQAERAARGYKDINLLAFKLLRPGGLLFTFSCSGGITADLFQKIVSGAAIDAAVDAEIVETMTQGADHPVALTFPEGAYLKGLVCYVRK